MPRALPRLTHGALGVLHPAQNRTARLPYCPTHPAPTVSVIVWVFPNFIPVDPIPESPALPNIC